MAASDSPISAGPARRPALIAPRAVPLRGIGAELRLGVRMTFRRPLFTAAAVFLLAIGIGSLTAVFSVVRTVLLRPLPYPDPERLVMVWETEPGVPQVPASDPNFLDWQAAARSFQAMAAVSPTRLALDHGSEPVRIPGVRAGAEIFEVLGVRPALGRGFTRDEQRRGERVVVLTASAWRRHLDGDPAAVGRVVIVDGEPHTLVGVMPPGFDVPTPWTVGRPTEALVPIRLTRSEDWRDSHWIATVARLADGVTVRQADDEMSRIAAEIARTHPVSNTDHGARVAPLAEELLGSSPLHLGILLLASVALLLIVCANVGGLLVARTSGRRVEFAVRASLGGERRHLLRQLLFEILPLVVLGGAVGTMLAHLTLSVMRSLIPTTLLRAREASIDGTTLAVTVLVSALVAILLGLGPAATLPRGRISDRLNRARATGGSAHSPLRWAATAGQIALTLVLANAAVVLLAGSLRLHATDFGFEAEHTLTTEMILSGPRYPDLGSIERFLAETTGRLAALPGVAAVAATSKLPLEGGTNGTVVIEGREQAWGREIGPVAERSLVTPGYFEAMAIAVLEGRPLEPTDSTDGAAVAVVNRAFVRAAWTDGSALGRRFKIGREGDWLTVVGVVADVRQWGAEYPARPEYYVPLTGLPAVWGDWQVDGARRQYLAVRSTMPLPALASALRHVVREVDPSLPLAELRTMGDVLSQATTRRRFQTTLITIFAGAALVLLASGLYGVSNTWVGQRTREVGVRMALGAQPAQVVRLVVGQSAVPMAVGLLVGAFGVLASAPFVLAIQYGARATDLLLVLAGIAVVLAVGFAGSLVPALRAVRIQPAEALRWEG